MVPLLGSMHFSLAFMISCHCEILDNSGFEYTSAIRQTVEPPGTTGHSWTFPASSPWVLMGNTGLQGIKKQSSVASVTPSERLNTEGSGTPNPN